ncbi:CAP domain-containing protein [Angustibacter sp. McL0619]|uniref:CAP domain-containing protein n=1 Tax=Angustibacter sp. McL0619 TaxID=3415676 RepID=UPI003CF407E9
MISRASTVLVLAVTALAATVLTAAPAQASSSSHTSYERQVVHEINVQRHLRGLRALHYTGCPDHFAESLATRLRTKSMRHQSLYPMLRRCDASRAGENIARARGYSAKRLVQLWMHSPEHRRNILDPRFNRIGVGTQCSSSCTTVTDFIRQ